MAALINLGIAGMRPAAGSLPNGRGSDARSQELPDPSMVEMGTTGTGIFGQGYIRELGEYNDLFSGGPFSAYRTYEQMRRGDAQVSATLMAMKLPVRCAEWAVQPPDDATPAEKECAELVEDCLFDEIDFDRMLENLLLALDFGAGCHEDIWTMTNGQVHLAKAAARMPLTFYTWTIDQQENLRELVQHGFHGGSFTEFVLPADKIALFTFRQEGANFAGRAIAREMYQHWYTKAALYKIDAIACERNGMGVPVGELAQGATKEDRATFEKFLHSVAAHQSAFIMHPFGYKFTLQGVQGQVRDCKDSIAHHNMQISMAALNTFMLMGQGSRGGGNRSLGETMSDFFFLSLQSLANQVGDAVSDATIARLAAYNYGPKVRPPRLVPQQIIAMKFDSVTDALAKLGTAKVLTPDPDLEMWVRQKMGAPKVERAEIVRLRAAAVTSGKGATTNGAAGATAAPGAAAETPVDGKGGKTGQEAGPTKNANAGGPGEGGEGPEKGEKVKASEVDGVKVRRAPVGAEKCLALSEIVGALDKGRDDIGAALRAARPRVQAEIVNKLVNTPVRNMHRVSIAPDEKVTAEIAGILRGIFDFGQKQVGEERARQRSGAAPSDASKIRGAAGKSKDDPIGLYADAAVSEFQNGLTARAANVAIDASRKKTGTKGEAINSINAALDDQSDKWIDGPASKAANEGFAEGREAGFEEYADEIASYIYSALLDLNTCEACAGADGMEGKSEDDIPDTPNPDCDGGDKCRCVKVAVFKDEKESAK